jgi:DDE superfamily endonuclease
VLLAGASAPGPLPIEPLVEADLLDQLPADLSALFTLLPQADLYLQDEVQFAFHPTLTRVWSLKGRRGQRLVESPGENRKVYGFGLLDWRDGWFDGRIAAGRTADVFCEQVQATVARSKRRGRVAIVIADNLKIHTAAGSLLVREPGFLSERRSFPSSIPLRMIPMPIALSGSGASRDGWSRIIINDQSSSSSSQMSTPIFRHSPGLPKMCSLISAVRSRQITRLLCRKLWPHESLGSI